jgi:hypothetical protein
MATLPFLLLLVNMICLFAYFATLARLLNYLRNVHTATWMEHGRLSFPPTPPIDFGTYIAFLRTMKFILFSNSYKILNDERLNRFIWSVRATFAAFLFLLGLTVSMRQT